jgi:hypothetical protein
MTSSLQYSDSIRKVCEENSVPAQHDKGLNPFHSFWSNAPSLDFPKDVMIKLLELKCIQLYHGTLSPDSSPKRTPTFQDAALSWLDHGFHERFKAAYRDNLRPEHILAIVTTPPERYKINPNPFLEEWRILAYQLL